MEVHNFNSLWHSVEFTGAELIKSTQALEEPLVGMSQVELGELDELVAPLQPSIVSLSWCAALARHRDVHRSIVCEFTYQSGGVRDVFFMYVHCGIFRGFSVASSLS